MWRQACAEAPGYHHLSGTMRRAYGRCRRRNADRYRCTLCAFWHMGHVSRYAATFSVFIICRCWLLCQCLRWYCTTGTPLGEPCVFIGEHGVLSSVGFFAACVGCGHTPRRPDTPRSPLGSGGQGGEGSMAHHDGIWRNFLHLKGRSIPYFSTVSQHSVVR
jgi:hypothetical protein